MSILERPLTLKTSAIDYWIEEEIWGHRFYNDQSPWFIFLEFLAVLHDRINAGQAFESTAHLGHHETFQYRMAKQLPVRYLLFNNPYLNHIERTESTDHARWEKWFNEIGAYADQDTQINGGFQYLKERFEYSELVRIVEVFQATAIGADSNKRWTSRFVFPHGPDCLYADLDGKKGAGNPDRRFFARGGELLYLMLARSGRGEVLLPLLKKKVFDIQNPWNQMLRALMPTAYQDQVVDNVSIGYLPYAARPEYEQLADDWITLLRLTMPGESVLDPLVRILGLHIVRYLFNRSHEVLGEDETTRFVLEVTAPNTTPLRKLSSDNYAANRRLPEFAVARHLDRFCDSSEWQTALQTDDEALARSVLIQRFSFKNNNRAIKKVKGTTPEQLFGSLKAAVISRHKQHFSEVSRELSRHIGLTVHRQGLKTRYAPTDPLLKALVYATVAERMEFHAFLDRLHEKYHFIIGPREAEASYGELPFDKRAFDDNAQRLESRLLALGLLCRLSDDCAYVMNPFGERHDPE